jgi:hypothetical protein
LEYSSPKNNLISFLYKYCQTKIFVVLTGLKMTENGVYGNLYFEIFNPLIRLEVYCSSGCNILDNLCIFTHDFIDLILKIFWIIINDLKRKINNRLVQHFNYNELTKKKEWNFNSFSKSMFLFLHICNKFKATNLKKQQIFD